MISGVSHEEIVDCLAPRRALSGSLFLNGDKIASLTENMSSLDVLRRKKPSLGDNVRILWDMSDRLILRLVYPYSRFEYETSHGRVTHAAARINWMSLQAIYGSGFVMPLPERVKSVTITLGPDMLMLPSQFQTLANATPLMPA